MTRRTLITLTLIGIAVIAVTWLIAAAFTRHQIKDASMGRVMALQDTILLRERQTRAAQVAEKDSIIAQLTRDAATATGRARSNKPYYETAATRLQQVRGTIDTLGDDALRRAYAEARD